jgi:uncharacterized cupredoxin-like copper-binding protein
MSNALRLTALLAAVVLIVAACASTGAPQWTYSPQGPTDTPGAVAPTPGTQQPTAAPTTPEQPDGVLGRLEIHAYDLGFQPTSLTVETAGTYEVVLINDGVIPHDIQFADGTLIYAEGGQSAVGEVYIPAEGMEFICSIVGHADAGMTGSVSVTGTGNGGDNGHGGHQPGTGTPPMTAEEMRDIDAARTAMFPAETEGRGGQLLEPVITDDGAQAVGADGKRVRMGDRAGRDRQGDGLQRHGARAGAARRAG